MKIFASLALSVIAVVPCAFAADSMTLHGVTLTLGMSTSALTASLPDTMRLAWDRDRLPKPVEATRTPNGVAYKSTVNVAGRPVTINYTDEFGQHGHIETTSGERLVAVVFDNDKLVRVMRIVDAPANATDLMASVAPILNRWGSNVTVNATHAGHGAGALDEIRFVSGSRQLIVLSLAGQTQIVENLGRDDIPSVTSR